MSQSQAALQPTQRNTAREETARYAPSAAVPEGRFTEDLNFRISDDCRVRLLFEGDVTKESIIKLAMYLRLAKDDYPSLREDTSGLTDEQERKAIGDIESLFDLTDKTVEGAA